VVRFGKHQQIPTFDEWFVERFGRERRIEVVTTAFNLVPQLLIGTSRIATLYGRLAMFYARYLPLKLVAAPVEIPPLEEHIQWHKSRDQDPGDGLVAFHPQKRPEPPCYSESRACRPGPSKKLDGETTSVIT
jgi:hypothetical protein